jgi:hypothetical protein
MLMNSKFLFNFWQNYFFNGIAHNEFAQNWEVSVVLDLALVEAEELLKIGFKEIAKML